MCIWTSGWGAQGNYRNVVITRSGTLVVKKPEGILLDTGI